MFLAFAEFTKAQMNGDSSNAETLAPISEAVTRSYTVFGATSLQETALRTQIRLMHPEILPLRIFFVPIGNTWMTLESFICMSLQGTAV